MGLPVSALRAPTFPKLETRISVSWRWVAFGLLLLVYVALTLAVVFPSPVLDLDNWLAHLYLRRNHPSWEPYVYYYVMFGQRGPATLLFLPYFCWVAWRRRSTEPLVMLGAALVLLNLSVGIVKEAIGRIGPRSTWRVHDVFAGGNIFPSGHVSNTVVLYGLIAWISLRWRKTAITAAVWLSVTVGLGTVYLRTHWFSDVVGGWVAGGLVLLVLPTAMPYAQRWTDAGVDWTRRTWRRRRGNASDNEPRAVAPTPARPAAPPAKVPSPVPVHRIPARSRPLVHTSPARESVDDPAPCR